MKREAQCKSCGARYALQSQQVPKAMRCFCEHTHFQIKER